MTFLRRFDVINWPRGNLRHSNKTLSLFAAEKGPFFPGITSSY